MIRWFVRVAFFALILFEIANYVRVLHFTPNYTWFGLLVTSLVVFVGIECGAVILRRKARVTLPWAVWPLALAVVALDAFGDIFHFYSRWSWYDQFGHFLGSLVTMVVIFSALIAIERTHGWQHPRHVNPLLALGLSMTLAILYEIEEYLEDYFGLSHRLGDGPDTANDLAMNLLGALTVVLVITFFRYAHRRHLR
ncbi:hypothetical protein HY478_00975 [Candidatus Uhrbacteria bacterium]|nr:hypothetical protein [Candidatus Uhrbacteria bacterium]